MTISGLALAAASSSSVVCGNHSSTKRYEDAPLNSTCCTLVSTTDEATRPLDYRQGGFGRPGDGIVSI